MTAHAHARIGWFMWTFPRLSAAVAEYHVRWRGWRDQRRAADGSPFWGDTGTTGDWNARPVVWTFTRDILPEPQVIDRDAASSAVHHWAKVAHDEIGAQYVPGRVPIPGSPARPGTPSVAAPGVVTGSDAATPPEAASSGGLPPPPAPDLPGPVLSTPISGGHETGSALGRAGEPHLPPPGTGDGRPHPAPAGGVRAAAALPEWVARLLTADDLDAAQAADRAHCERMAVTS